VTALETFYEFVKLGLKIVEERILRMPERSDLRKLSIFNSQYSIPKGAEMKRFVKGIMQLVAIWLIQWTRAGRS